MDLVYIIVINISLGIILFNIFISSLLYKRYRLPFLSSYFFFQIFTAIFGTYGILVPGIIRKVLAGQEISSVNVESIAHFFTFLGIPFLILAWFMFLRLCHELVDRKMRHWLTLLFLLVSFLFFAGYGLLLWLMRDPAFGQFDRVSDSIRYASGGLGFLVLCTGIIILIFAAGYQDRISRTVLRRFAALNLVIYSTLILLLFFAGTHELLSSAFLFLLFSGSLGPILFIHGFIKRTVPVPAGQMEQIVNLEQFILKFGISKREEEIIRQICLGKSNREISEALFITLQTVKDHIYRIFLKTGVKNRVQLTNLIRGLEE